MELWVATGNKGKLIEFRTLLPQFEIHAQSELAVFASPPENGQTFLDNARIKARALKSVKTGVWVVADDSGLCVEGLNNLPGVHSARYAGPKATDMENTAKLMKMMSLRSAHNRNAKFVCTMCVYSPEGKEFVVEGEILGKISEKVRGTDGFGYDPVFIPNGEEKTFAEIGLTKKNQISHRAQAIRKLTEILK
jgi:XTP/dITP diphosphohydrolase